MFALTADSAWGYQRVPVLMFVFGISGRAIILANAAIVNVLLVTASGWWGMMTLEQTVKDTADNGLVLGN